MMNPYDDLLEITQDHIRRFGLDGAIVTKGVSIVEMMLPTGERTYRVLPVGDCKSWEARGLIGEAVSDMDSRNLLFWNSIADRLEGDDET